VGLLSDQSSSNIKQSGDFSLVSRATVLSVANATSVEINWNNSVADDVGGFNLGSNSTDYVVPEGVDYVDIDLGVMWSGNFTGERRITISKNSLPLENAVRKIYLPSSESSNGITAKQVPVFAGDIISIEVFQTSGAALNIINGSGTFFKVVVSKRYR